MFSYYVKMHLDFHFFKFTFMIKNTFMIKPNNICLL